MLTRNICSEYGQYNIQCNAIGQDPNNLEASKFRDEIEEQPDVKVND